MRALSDLCVSAPLISQFRSYIPKIRSDLEHARVSYCLCYSSLTLLALKPQVGVREFL